MKVYFFLARKRLNRKGMCPITCRISESQHDREDFRTKLFIEPAQWDTLRGCPLDQQSFTSARLSAILAKIHQLIIIAGDKATPRDIVESYRTSGKTKPTTINQIVEEMYEKKMYSADIKKRMASGVNEFIAYTRNLTLSKVHQWHIEGFHKHLSTKQSQFTIEKKVSHIKRLFTYAKDNEYINVSPFVNYKFPQLPALNPLSLAEDEIETLTTKELSPRRTYIRDLFLFQCYTGLAYCDLFLFNKEMIVSKNGTEFLSGKRGKNGASYYLPFLPEAKLLAEKYNYRFPEVSNNRYNKQLKKIANDCKIDKAFTTHSGRKTFGQIMIDRGYSAESVSKMLGHASFNMTQKHYARISEKRIENEHGTLKAA